MYSISVNLKIFESQQYIFISLKYSYLSTHKLFFTFSHFADYCLPTNYGVFLYLLINLNQQLLFVESSGSSKS